jgi:hypothetical protein
MCQPPLPISHQPPFKLKETQTANSKGRREGPICKKFRLGQELLKQCHAGVTDRQKAATESLTSVLRETFDAAVFYFFASGTGLAQY